MSKFSMSTIFADCHFAKTNIYIKTPYINANPIFVITGSPEDVDAAKQLLLRDADQITQRRTSLPRPEIVTRCVEVPSSDHVAKIVGEKMPEDQGTKRLPS